MNFLIKDAGVGGVAFVGSLEGQGAEQSVFENASGAFRSKC